MTWRRRATPWLFAACGLATLAMECVGGPGFEPVRQSIVLGGYAVTVALVARRRLVSLVTAVVLGMVALRLATLDITVETSSIAAMTWRESLVALAVPTLLVAAVLAAVQRRRGLDRRDFLDGATVVIAGTLISWLMVVRPLVGEHQIPAAPAIAIALHFPLTALAATFAMDLRDAGLTGNRSMRFILIAACFNLLGSITRALGLTGAIDNAGTLTVAWFTAGFFMLCAALHADDRREVLRPMPDDRRNGRVDGHIHLAAIAIALIVPAFLLATTAPSSDTDRLIRTVGTLVLVTAALVRLNLAIIDTERSKQALVRRLYCDDLTGLATRSRFVDVVAEMLDGTWRTEHRPTLVQLNIDRFKNINDSLGHEDANQVLVEIAARLNAVCESVGAVAGRVGGDDFVIVVKETTSSADADRIIATIRDSLAGPVRVGDSTIFVTMSIGVAIAPRNRTISAEDLMRRADIATHQAKADGRNRVVVFDDPMQSNLASRMDVEHALHGAIGRQEMRLYHQPIVDITTGRLCGFEALIRWQRHDRLVPPTEFISIAEETGVINQLGSWALREALRELRRWLDDGLVAPTTTISVNVSPRQIADPSFVDVVRSALDETGVSPHLLWIEMTESMMLEDPERAQTTLRQIRAMGVRIALDDFGTGYSSLSLLQQFPIQRIKIDRAFVQGIAERSNDRSLVRTIVAMARSMGLDLVAEGVETVHQMNSLRELGCDKAQGYLISRPVPADAMRTTMVAIAELGELSLFGGSGGLERSDVPAIGVGASRMFEVASGPSRPIGAPRI